MIMRGAGVVSLSWRVKETANSKNGNFGVWFDKNTTLFVHSQFFQSLTGIKIVKDC